MTMENDSMVFKTAMFAGEIMAKSGSETYRAEDTIKRMLKSRGYDNVSTFVSPTVIIVGDNERDGFCYVKNIGKRSSNLSKIEVTNDISRKYVNHEINTEEAYDLLTEANQVSPYNYPTILIGCGFSCAIFSVLIGGNLLDFMITFFTSIIALHISEIINAYNSAVFLGNFIASLIVTIIAILFNKFGLGSSLESTVVGSVLPLVPGVAFTGGIRDFISGDLLSGTAKSIEAVMIGIAIAFGVGASLTFFSALGGL